MLFGKKKKSPSATASGVTAQDTAAPVPRAPEAAASPEVDAETTALESGAGADAGAAGAGSAPDPAAEQDLSAGSESAAAAAVESAAAAAAPEDAPRGAPRDVAELSSTKGFLDFGALLIPAAPNQKVRLDIDQKTKRVVALTIALGQASIQLQPFSAPKSGGTWEEVRGQIAESVRGQKGRVKEVEGRFGTELAARVPTVLKDGRQGWRVARFIGFEGPRWFLRGVVGGRGAIDASAAREVEDFFASIVVVRGEDPLPPRELLTLRPPEGAKRVAVPRNPAERRDGTSPSPGAAALDSAPGGQT